MLGVGVGINHVRGKKRLFAPPPLTVVTPPSLSGVPEVGQRLDIAAMTTTPEATETEQRWLRDGNVIVGAVGMTRILAALDDARTVTAQQRARAAGTAWTDWQTAGSFAVTYPAPSAAGGIGSFTWTQGSGSRTIDFAPDFTGAEGGSWSVSGAGATIDQNGRATVPTDAPLASADVIATYTNSGGSDSSTAVVTVESGIVPAFTAFTPPAMNFLWDQATLADMEDWAVMTGAGNFMSNAGGEVVDRVAVAIYRDGDLDPEADENTPLETDEVIHYVVTVTGDMGTVTEFESDQGTVEYRAISEITGSNTFRLTFNARVPSTETAPVTISGTGAMDGTYQVLKSDTESGVPFVLAGSIVADHDGLLADLTTGSTIRHTYGFWFHTEGDTLALETRAQADTAGNGIFTDLGNPGDESYVLTASELGDDYRVKVIATPGVGAPVTEYSEAIGIPAGSSGGAIAVTRFASVADNSGGTTLDLASVAPGTIVRCFVGTFMSSGKYPASVTVNGSAATILHQTSTTIFPVISYVEFTRQAGIDTYLVTGIVDSGSQGALSTCWAVGFTFDRQSPIHDTDSASQPSTSGTLSGTVDVVNEGVVIGVGIDSNNSATPGSNATLDNELVTDSPGTPNRDLLSGWKAITATASGQTYQFDPGATGGFASAFLVISYA